MKRDRIIAISERVACEVPTPIDLGALRSADSEISWREEATLAVAKGERVVLSGDISNFAKLVATITEILLETPRARFALLIHAMQARASGPPNAALSLFESIYVATTENIEPVDIRQIEVWWHPIWVLLPIAEINRADWIPRFLLPGRQGRILLLATKNSLITPDELRLQIQDFSFEHPLIEIRPAPPEWYEPSELGPWRSATREAHRSQVVRDSRARTDYPLSVIVPFRWTGESSQSERLLRTIDSVTRTFAQAKSYEVIVAIDRDRDCELLPTHAFHDESHSIAFVDIERANREPDWRAGFIRNCGADFARNQSGFLLFIDADVVIAPTEELTRAIQNIMSTDSIDLVQVSDFPDVEAFTTASSSLLLVRATLFALVGGFADAFSRYGCEDNFFVWRAAALRARIRTIPSAAIEHARPRIDSDDLVAKMLRLRPSADLMYRMTLDPAVHRHFFSALGPDLWMRAALKRIAGHPLPRIFLAPFVFLLTMLETRHRGKYLASFVEISVWKLKRPAMWIRSNSWRTEAVAHAWRAHAWKIPNFFVSTFGVAKMAFQKRAISLRASRFGWSLLDWRLQRWWKNACDQVAWRTSVAKVRFSGACLWILTAIVSLFSNVSWGIRVGCQRSVGAVKRFFGCVHANTARALGRSHGYVEDIKGASKRIVVMYVVVPLAFIATRPRELWKLHSWRISKIRQDIAAELWFFEEPSAWVELRMPQFNRMLWKPVGKIWRRLVKVWHFVEYQLSKRWRKSQ